MRVTRWKPMVGGTSAVEECSSSAGIGAAESDFVRAPSHDTSQTKTETKSAVNIGFSCTLATAFGEMSQA